jgi:hypothetical protein
VARRGPSSVSITAGQRHLGLEDHEYRRVWAKAFGSRRAVDEIPVRLTFGRIRSPGAAAGRVARRPPRNGTRKACFSLQRATVRVTRVHLDLQVEVGADEIMQVRCGCITLRLRRRHPATRGIARAQSPI